MAFWCTGGSVAGSGGRAAPLAVAERASSVCKLCSWQIWLELAPGGCVSALDRALPSDKPIHVPPLPSQLL